MMETKGLKNIRLIKHYFQCRLLLSTPSLAKIIETNTGKNNIMRHTKTTPKKEVLASYPNAELFPSFQGYIIREGILGHIMGAGYTKQGAWLSAKQYTDRIKLQQRVDETID